VRGFPSFFPLSFFHLFLLFFLFPFPPHTHANRCARFAFLFPTFSPCFSSHARTQALRTRTHPGTTHHVFPLTPPFLMNMQTGNVRVSGTRSRRRARRSPPPSPSHTHAHRRYISLVQVAADMRISLLFFSFSPHTHEHRHYTTLAQVAGDMFVFLTFFAFSPHTHAHRHYASLAGDVRVFLTFSTFSSFFSVFHTFFPSPPHTHAHRHYASLAQVAGDVRIFLTFFPFPSLFFLFPLTRANTGTTRRWRRWRETCASFSMI